jgi:hypothetical protein
MSEAPIDKLNDESNDDLKAQYAAAVAFWTNGNQERWSILNNFFVASTILILAWAAVWTSPKSDSRPLCLFSIAGVVLSAGWGVIMYRTWRFIHAFGEAGENLEKRIFKDRQDFPGPFVVGEITREKLKPIPVVGFLSARNSTISISIVFVLVFAALFALSFAQSGKAGTEGISDGEILGDRAARSGDLRLRGETVLDSARQSGSRSHDPPSVQSHGPDKPTASMPAR